MIRVSNHITLLMVALFLAKPEVQMKTSFLSLTVLGVAIAVSAPTGKAAAESAVEDEATVAVNRLAATLAAAHSVEQISAIITEARASGLNDRQIAFAFGLASRMTPVPEILDKSFQRFRENAKIAAEEVNLAFASGVQSVSGQGAGAAGSGAGGAFGNPPLGAAGLQGGGIGGGGASPK